MEEGERKTERKAERESSNVIKRERRIEREQRVQAFSLMNADERADSKENQLSF